MKPETATEWRKPIAHGASRGNRAKKSLAPEGRQNSASSRGVLSPLRGSNPSTIRPTACAVGYSLSLLRSYSPPLSKTDLRHAPRDFGEFYCRLRLFSAGLETPASLAGRDACRHRCRQPAGAPATCRRSNNGSPLARNSANKVVLILPL